MTRNIPLSIDDELLAEIDSIAESTKESRSAVMRRAIREGLPLVKTGGGADVLTLDSETSRDATKASEETEVSRAKFLIESIRAGLQAAYWRLMRDKWVRVQEQHPSGEEAEGWIRAFEDSMFRDDPMGREVRLAMRQRGAALRRLGDILDHVPEAFARMKLADKLIKLRRSTGDNFGVYGCGLSNSEIAWQIEMREKYGKGNTPDHEVAAHEAVRKLEEPGQRKHMDEVSEYTKPPYPEQ